MGMKILKDYDLTKLNTFGISARAKFFAEIKSEFDLKELFQSQEFKNNKKLFLGGGSNILITHDFDGLIILNRLKGIEILSETGDNVFIKSMGGEMWHELVRFTVNRGLWGIENLSSIPGTVGAAPMQNIGAYGVEIKDTLENVETYELETGEKKIFKNEECKFGYRDSFFKSKLKEKYFITAVTLKLSKKENKRLEYKILQEYLKENKIEVKNSKNVSEAITAIRKSKLPDPKVIGNAGSFFKNIFLTEKKMKDLLVTYPEMPHFEEDGMIKISAAWLIEKCGWKGQRVGNAGVHDRQALVLVNHGGATGEEIKELSEKIIASVFSKFGLTLEREVNLI